MESLWRDPHRPACDSTTPHIRSAATQLTVYRVPRDESRESRGGESRERPPISPRRWREHDTHIGSHHMTSKYEERWKNDLQRNHRAAVATCDVTMLVKVCPAVRHRRWRTVGAESGTPVTPYGARFSSKFTVRA